jgi:ABC-type sugar transport system ATPase subunit
MMLPLCLVLNHTLPKGVIIGLVGLEGSGQRIFMQHLAGTTHPDHGQVHFNGQPLTRPTHWLLGSCRRTACTRVLLAQ